MFIYYVGGTAGAPKSICFNPHNYYSRAMMIYGRGTLSRVQAYTREKLYVFFFFFFVLPLPRPLSTVQTVCRVVFCTGDKI